MHETEPSSKVIQQLEQLEPRQITVIDPNYLGELWKEDKDYQSLKDLVMATHLDVKTVARILDLPASPPPSAYILEMLVPMGTTKDFLANLTEIFEEKWLPAYGERRARRLWHRQCIGLIARHWFDVGVTAIERFRKAIISWG